MALKFLFPSSEKRCGDCVQFSSTAPHICEYQARRDDGSLGPDLVAFVRVGVEQNALTGT